MTGKEFRKGLKKLFKEKGIDDLNVSVVGNNFTFLTLFTENEDGSLGDTVYTLNGGRHGDNPDEFYVRIKDRPIR